MILKGLKYIRYIGEPREWSIIGKDGDYASFGNINLLVGKNASGKSRTLDVIREIAGLLSGKIELKRASNRSEHYDLVFSQGDCQYRYILDLKNRVITSEILLKDDKTLIDRREGVFSNEDGQNIPLTQDDTKPLISLSDENKMPYFKDFMFWGASLKNYLFANHIEKNRLVKDYRNLDKENQIETFDILIHVFYRGKQEFGNAFISEIISGMQALEYNISNICINGTEGYYGLVVEEEGEYTVTQKDMSQGMFRTLALFILLTYARLSNISVCLLIDDMGEGLDAESSKRMMDIVIQKINNSSIQLFLSTNDRYVMNEIPLRYWSVIERVHGKSLFYDYTNSKDTFDDFKYTGLNNFDFLVTDFYKNGFGVIDENDD